MIIYNVTVNIEDDIQDEWFTWMKKKHIPDILQTGFFVDYKMLKLLNVESGTTGTTYAVQYYCPNISNLERYLEDFAPALRDDSIARFGDAFIAYHTFFEEV